MNLELGGRLDAENGQSTARFAFFHSTKHNERNTDPLLPVVTLSGKRHVAGLELDLAGRLSPKWEVFSSYTWMPIAKVDKAAPCPATGGCAQGAIGERPGDRPALTPHYSAVAWTTYQLDPRFRFGAGLNARGKQRPTRVAFHVPAYVTLDLMAEYAVILDRFILKANLNNVTDKLYAEQLYPAHYVPGAGRNLQVTATVKF
ncbi:MAG: TonB-dependent receptor domain-containing protein, partial [Burkholderiaceae bacterium]